jgi:primosomal protein N' (replication factor Y)
VVLGEVAEPEVPETKAIRALVDAQAALTRPQIELAREMAESTIAPLSACIGLMLPAGLSQQADTLFSLPDEGKDIPEISDLPETSQRLLALLRKRGPLRGRQIDRAIPRRGWRAEARKLIRDELLASEPVLPPSSVRPKYIRTAQLAVPPEDIESHKDALGHTKATKTRRQKMLHFLAAEPQPVDVNWVYAESGGKLSDLQLISEMGLVMLREEEAWRDPLAGLEYDPKLPPTLTGDQQAAWQEIAGGLARAANGEKVKPYLLHGVTGSGKTEIYLRAVAEALRQGKQAIVLVPEIALTPHTVRRFMARFPGRVGLMHSKLSPGERYDTWRRARGVGEGNAGQLKVIIGPRSALFAPLPNIGIIVVDEAHDDSYYQGEIPPHYHARETAIAYAGLLGAVCILGSATPDTVSYYQAQQGKFKLLELPARILAHRNTVNAYRKKLGRDALYLPAGGDAQMANLPNVKVVDMREELKEGNRSIFSMSLQENLRQVLESGQQAILFLNRLGTSTYVFCRDCGHTLRCPRCETSFTYHAGRKMALVCHHCGYQRQMPKTCPNCGSERIRHYGTGTERVETELQELFPDARILRWDSESTRQKGSHEMILSHFTNQRADVLIGTQMLAKGLDLPLVTLVGAVLADVGLHLPDHRAGERVFQVLSQVAGRAGRSPLGGRVILQTFHPGHYVIEAAARHDYAGFYKRELDYRRRLKFPPFSKLVRLEYRHHKAQQAQEEAERMAQQIRTWIQREERRATEMIGPAPCFYARLGGEYRWQIILRGPDPASLLQGRKLGDWRLEANPQALL